MKEKEYVSCWAQTDSKNRIIALKQKSNISSGTILKKVVLLFLWQVLGKLETMSDAEFAEVALEAAE